MVGRRNRRGHKDTSDLISDGMKYASMFGLGSQALKTLGHSNDNGSSQGQRDAPPGFPMGQPQGPYSTPPMQYQQQPMQYQQQPWQYQQQSIQFQQQQVQYREQPIQYREQPVQHREQVIQRQEDMSSPPPYSEQPRTQSAASEGAKLEHQPWCNGRCNGGCTRAAAASAQRRSQATEDDNEEKVIKH